MVLFKLSQASTFNSCVNIDANELNKRRGKNDRTAERKEKAK